MGRCDDDVVGHVLQLAAGNRTPPCARHWAQARPQPAPGGGKVVRSLPLLTTGDPFDLDGWQRDETLAWMRVSSVHRPGAASASGRRQAGARLAVHGHTAFGPRHSGRRAPPAPLMMRPAAFATQCNNRMDGRIGALCVHLHTAPSSAAAAAWAKGLRRLVAAAEAELRQKLQLREAVRRMQRAQGARPGPEQANVVYLDVGGTRFHTTPAVLLPADDDRHYFAVLLEGLFADEEDDDGYVFVDRDPHGFRFVLGSLRHAARRGGPAEVPASAVSSVARPGRRPGGGLLPREFRFFGLSHGQY